MPNFTDECGTKTNNVHHSSLTGGRILARNTIFNLVGHGVPLLVALFAIPVLISGLGTERFGVLSLAWMIVGYFGLFDLGIGRATTKFVADNMARGETAVLPQLVWTSVGMLLCFGLAGSILLRLLTPLLVSRFFTIPPHLHEETVNAFYLIAASVPLVLGTAGTRGVLEAQQRFGLINAVKIPVSAAFYGAPLLVLPFSNSLFPITAVLVAIRIVEFIAYLLFCLQSIPGMNYPQWPNSAYVKQLLGFGGWLTVTNIVGPFMTYMDRFLIGGILSMSAVAFYATPYDFVARLTVIPGSVLSVMFPALSASFVAGPERFTMLYDKTAKYILLVMAPVVLMFTVMADPFLHLWLGQEFATQSALVFQILSIGTLVNSIAQVPYGAIQAMGRPDLTAKIHLTELPLYLGMIWVLVLKTGIVGAALAWLIRAVIDTAVLYLVADRMLPEKRVTDTVFVKTLVVFTGTLCLSSYISSIMNGFVPRLVFLFFCLSSVALCFWRILMNSDDRSMVTAFIHRLMHRPVHG